MQVAPSVDIDHVPGDEVAFDEESDCLGDVLWSTVALERNGVHKIFNIAFIFAGRRQDQPLGQQR